MLELGKDGPDMMRDGRGAGEEEDSDKIQTEASSMNMMQSC